MLKLDDQAVETETPIMDKTKKIIISDMFFFFYPQKKKNKLNQKLKRKFKIILNALNLRHRFLFFESNVENENE